MRLDLILQAINILKQKFNQIRLDIEQYDPTNPLVEDVEETANNTILILT